MAPKTLTETGTDVVYENLVGGEWSTPEGVEMIENVNPARTDEVLGRFPASPASVLDEAVARAVEAQREWAAVPAPSRARIVGKAHDILSERVEEVATLLTREEGKVIAEARGEVKKTLLLLEWFAGTGTRLRGYTAPSELPQNLAFTTREPIGVVGLITPWNFPVAIPAWKIAPALVCGNAVVLKPAEQTPATARAVVQTYVEAGVPEGVLSLVYGRGEEVGDGLVKHPDVRAISFTGSSETGRIVSREAGARLKAIQCEMGGKNPIVVLDDADVDDAIDAAARGAFGSTGQRCTATSRAIVTPGVADAFVEGVVERAKAVRAGDGLEPETTMGPSVDADQLSKVLSYMEIAPECAEVLCGGERLADGDLANGLFPAPTVVDEVEPGSRIATEEIFGPVLSVFRVEDLGEALEVANEVEYGLTSSVYTSDGSTALRFADGIETGITHVNCPTMGGEAHLPFGGIKATGMGPREFADGAIEFFSEEKVVYWDYTTDEGDRDANFY